MMRPHPKPMSETITTRMTPRSARAGKVDVFLNLEGWLRCVRDEISRKDVMELFELRVDGLTNLAICF